MLTLLDISIIAGYLVFAFAIGLAAAKKAGEGLDSYFVAGRSLPWWWLGTSMVATTFASDTPLVVAGFVAEYGIAGNWFWWSLVTSFIMVAVFFARMWRKSGVITDAEIIELRYDTKAAAGLRMYKAISASLFFNCIVLGWVFAAMAKITRPFLHWQEILGTDAFTSLSNSWPDFLLFTSLDNTLTIFVLLAVVLVYSSAGGIRGVILTDLVQFLLAMTAAVIFAWLCVDYVGGLSQLYTKLGDLYPGDNGQPSAETLTAFWPSLGEGGLMSFGAFMASIGVLWWANNMVDGSGYYAQRINTAKTPEDAEWGTLWFGFANFVLRSWPWITVGLVALVVFPLGDPAASHEAGSAMGTDREMAYPLLMKLILPSGLLGLVLASLIAAFMSTVDTHINWGASYLANDIYFRFMRKDASQSELVWVSRGSVLLIGIVAIFVAAQIEHVGDMWKFNLAMLSGLGVPHLLRWFWWRANAWTELAGMTCGLVLAIVAYTTGFADRFVDEYVISAIATLSGITAIVVTLLTPPVADEHLEKFCAQVKPLGAWRDFSQAPRGELSIRLKAWLSGVIAVYAGLFSGGSFLKQNPLTGLVLAVVCVASGLYTLRQLKAAQIKSAQASAGETSSS